MWKSRLIYSIIVFAAFIFSQALYDSVSLLTLIVLLALPVISIVLALISFPLVNVKTSVSNGNLFRFDSFLIRITMCNSSPFILPSFRVFCSVPDSTGQKIEKVIFAVSSSCGRRGFFDYKCHFANRGVFTLNVDSVEYYDFLKLIKMKKSFNREIRVICKPRRIELALPVSSELKNQENTNIVGTSTVVNGGDMIGVRDYSFGDNIKNVHWKLSSKSDNLVMKAFAEDIYDQAYVIADMSAYYPDDLLSKSMTDCVVEAALSVVRDYQKNGIRFSLITNLGKSEVVKYSIDSPQDLFQAEAFLSMTPMVKDTTVDDLLKNVDFNAITGCEVCIITSFGSPEMAKNIKKHFIDKKTNLRIINISLHDNKEDAGVISYTKDYIERQGRA